MLNKVLLKRNVMSIQVSLGRSESDSAIRAVESGQFANEAAFLIYTSGTTGHPKGIREK